MRFRKARFVGSVASQGAALNALLAPGDIAVVERGIPRSIVMKCPDGCGETLTVNLDKRTDKAWRFYNRDKGISLFPSVWRTSGCRSHFVIWENGIYWSDGLDSHRDTWEHTKLTHPVKDRLKLESFTSPVEIADQLDEVPWAIASVCRKLVWDKEAEEGVGEFEGMYRLVPR